MCEDMWICEGHNLIYNNGRCCFFHNEQVAGAGMT